MGNLENVEYVRFLAHFCKKCCPIMSTRLYTKKSTCFGEKHVDELVDNVDNSTYQGGFLRFYIRLLPP